MPPLFSNISYCCRNIRCFNIEVIRSEITFNVLHTEKNIDITIECFIFVFIFADFTSVAINCKFYVYHPYVGTINVKLTTMSLASNFVLPYGLGKGSFIFKCFFRGTKTCSSRNGC
jgi:hypothetical protein